MELLGDLLLFVALAIAGIAASVRSVPLFIALLDEDEDGN
jgi:hypothetical protein